MLRERRLPGALPVIRMCRGLALDRSGIYRSQPKPTEHEMALRDAIQRIAVAWPNYGYRMITHQLRRQKWKVGTRRVRRIMREDNLLCLRRRKSWIRYPRHKLPRYPNLAAGFMPTGIDQLWIADLTYIRLCLGFVYLAVILDAFSRRAIGWALGKVLDAELTVVALRMALQRRRPGLGCIHHSDGGMQYAAYDYVDLLDQHGLRPSMSRPGTPTDNPRCERFIRTLKYDEVYLRDYESFEEAHASIGKFIDIVYNQKRLHSMLGYVPPAEFEASLSNLSTQSADSTAATTTMTSLPSLT